MPNTQHEITEEFITPMKKDRKIDISTNKIEFSPVERVEPEELADSPRDTSRTLVDYSLSDMESTLRPPTPETAPPIEEDMIMPTVVKKGEMTAPFPEMEILPDTALNRQDNSNSASSSEDESQITQIENTSAEIEKDWTEMALNLKSKMDLFSTPYPSRNTKESTSGMSYNISLDELNDIEARLRSEIKEKKVETPKKGGIGFEVRDDVTSGELKNVELDNKIIRPLSYTDRLNEATEKTISKYRASSFKEDLRKAGKDSNDNPLDWSRKKTDIPQDDSVNDWTDPNVVNESDEHVKLQTSLSSDFTSDANSNFLAKKPLTKATLFKARDNLADLSDNSDSFSAVSDPSSGSSSPPPPYIANGEDNRIVTSPETTPVKSPFTLSEKQTNTKISTDNEDSDMKINTDIIPTVTTKYEGSGAYTVTVNRQQEDDTDC
ncbi:hypothetical protein KUTeg_013670 [Tegillarca granosa]|uniref:Uncharacterized protein n=1 Tax=Tegillarca granosa TaxID=220873 RepID=A0ABQ9EUC8_TEGGR|nr:hypothetical protein KUTeg_013670 [Tegillarca granosa]